jgi:hypothetical protein
MHIQNNRRLNRFKNINSQKTIDAISRLCRMMAHYGNVLNITSHFLNLAEEDSPVALAALFCLNEFSKSPESPESSIPLRDPRFKSLSPEFISILETDLAAATRIENEKEGAENIESTLENVCFILYLTYSESLNQHPIPPESYLGIFTFTYSSIKIYFSNISPGHCASSSRHGQYCHSFRASILSKDFALLYS